MEATTGTAIEDMAATINKARRRPARPGHGTARLAALAVALLIPAGVTLVSPPVRAAEPVAFPAVFLRLEGDAVGDDLEVVLAGPDGVDRSVMRLPGSSLPDGRRFGGWGTVSLDGWLAAGLEPGDPCCAKEYAFGLYDLADLARPPLILPYAPVIGGAWGPAGRFATRGLESAEADHRIVSEGIIVVDAPTGARMVFRDILSLPGGGPDLVWAADGSGLLTTSASHGPHAGDLPEVWGIDRVDGGPRQPGVPDLATWTGYVASGGRMLEWDGTPGPPGPVVTTEPDGSRLTWYTDELAPEPLQSVALSGDGRSVWLVFDRAIPEGHLVTLARVDEPGKPVVVATVPMGPEITFVGYPSPAPDDSVVMLYTIAGDEPAPPWMIPTDGTPAMAPPDGPIGFTADPATWQARRAAVDLPPLVSPRP